MFLLFDIMRKGIAKGKLYNENDCGCLDEMGQIWNLGLYNCNPRVCWHNNTASGVTSVIAEYEYPKRKSLCWELHRKMMRMMGWLWIMLRCILEL